MQSLLEAAALLYVTEVTESSKVDALLLSAVKSAKGTATRNVMCVLLLMHIFDCFFQ